MANYFLKILNKLRLLPSFNLSGNVLINDVKFRIPIIQGVGYTNLSISEPWMIELLKIILPLGDKKFVDVGVNIGQTLLKLKSVKSDIDYIGFEPNSNCVQYIDNLIRANLLTEITIVPVGISFENTIGELNYYYDSSTDSSASMLSDFRPEQKIIKKEFIPLFDVNKLKSIININEISILKIDVEGAELEVINSFKDLIIENEPIILMEILPVYSLENNFRINRQNEIENLLLSAGYSIYRVLKDRDILVDLVEIKEIGIHADLNNCEYVMIPTSKKEKFIKVLNQWINNEIL
jgi:FkbM family methyltransferase